MFCLITGPRWMESTHHKLKILKPWAKTNLSYFELLYLRYFAPVTNQDKTSDYKLCRLHLSFCEDLAFRKTYTYCPCIRPSPSVCGPVLIGHRSGNRYHVWLWMCKITASDSPWSHTGWSLCFGVGSIHNPWAGAWQSPSNRDRDLFPISEKMWISAVLK
jgi:hypothetical protein